MAYSIKRSSTGKYHLSLGGSTAMCNGRSGNFASVHPATADNAPESMFCGKCFTFTGEGVKAEIQRMREIGLLE